MPTRKKMISLALKNAVRTILPSGYLLRRAVRQCLKKGEPELRLLPCLCSRLEIAIDVGANLGIYSYLFSQYSDRVIAVEPHPVLATQLRRLLPASVSVLNFAASDEEGVSDFYIPTLDGSEIHSRSSLVSTANPGMISRKILVEKRRLDRLPIDGGSVAVVKIDVEGHELGALQGLSGIIARSRPTIIVESEARHHADAPFSIFDFLHSFGYLGYFIHRGTLRLVSEFSVEKFQVEADTELGPRDRSPEYVNNFIFVHPVRSSVLDELRRFFTPQTTDPS
jgi:FkbM family methyltransferase